MRPGPILVLLVIAACTKPDEPAIDTASVPAADDTTQFPSRDRPADTSQLSELDCGVSGTPVLTEEGIGELRQGRPVTEVKALCEVLSDTEQRGVEGMMERALVVRVAGETVRAVVDRDRIFRIEINTPRFRTADSLGVDTPLRRIAQLRGAQFAPGENGVYGFGSDHCGLSFRFSLPWRPPAGGQWTAAAIAERHGDAAVNRVIVIECTR